MKRLGHEFQAVVKLIPKKLHPQLGVSITQFIMTQSISGIASRNLFLLAASLRAKGYFYLGDVIQASRNDVLASAESLKSVKDVNRLVTHFEKVLANKGLSLGMRPSGWQRPARLSLGQGIAIRDARNAFEKQQNLNRRRYLRLVTD